MNDYGVRSGFGLLRPSTLLVLVSITSLLGTMMAAPRLGRRTSTTALANPRFTLRRGLRMTGSELAVRSGRSPALDDWSEALERAKQAISIAGTLEDLKEISDVAQAGKTFAKAKKSREMMDLACEVGLRAERRAGQVLLTLPRLYGGTPHEGLTPLQKAVEELGVDSARVGHWQHMARFSDEVFEWALSELKAGGRIISYPGLRQMVLTRRVAPVEKGISRLVDGRFQITWSEHGVERT